MNILTASPDEIREFADMLESGHPPVDIEVVLMAYCINLRAAASRIDSLEKQIAHQGRCEEIEAERDGLQRFKAGVDEALNSGDGSYRP